MDCRRGPSRHPVALSLDGPRPIAPSHGENMGSSPLGSANEINHLLETDQLLSNICPINVHGQAWTTSVFLDWALGTLQWALAESGVRTVRHSPASKFQRSTSSALVFQPN